MQTMLWTVFQIAIGGALGAVGRYFTSTTITRIVGSDFPYGTLTVNIGGSLVIGILFVQFGGLTGESNRYAPLVMTGFLGGYTTFSAFSLDYWLLFQQGRIFESLAYAIGSAVLSIAAVFVGIAVARCFQ